MAPRKKNGTFRFESYELEDRMMYEEELNVLKTIVKEQKEEIEALKRDADEKQRKHETTVEDMQKVIEHLDEKVHSKKIDNDKEKKKFKDFIEEMKDKIECPVCLEVPRSGPIPVCPNGHVVCNKCKTDSCPTCRVAMGNGKSLLASIVIENIDHKCKFDDCEDLFAVDKLDDHAKICAHRTVKCPHHNCSEKVSLSKLLDHLGKNKCSFDDAPKLIEKYPPVGTRSYTFKDQLKVDDITWRMNIFTYEDVNFAILPEKFDGFYYVSFVMFSSEVECSKYKIEMTLHERGSTSQDAEVSFKYCGKPCSIDGEKSDYKYYGVAVNTKGMEGILKTRINNLFGFKVTFSIRKLD
eukprot:GFUD01002745.1.p1 GENE.GFUD01002745.1~~GFUD01002745.1.p1  ORF type:complete len:366 (+),score=80.48 GFUD01002745.1:43-1098(+)